MRKKLQLHIPQPCHEDWNNMKPVEQGKFCMSCQKSVVDFTEMNDRQILAFFQKPSTGSVCGRFQDSQLQRNIEAPKKSLPWVKYFFQFTLPAFLISMKADAQKEKPKTVIEIVSDKSILGKMQAVSPIDQSSDSLDIKGRVEDEEGNPIAYSTVFIKGASRGIVTDSNGCFSIKVEAGERPITLLASSVGFNSVEKKIDIQNYVPGTVITMATSLQMLGEVVVGVIVSNHVKRLTMGGTAIKCTRNIIKDTIASLFDKFSVYPNPVVAGQSIVIENKKLAADNYGLELINQAGQTVHTEVISIGRKQKIFLNTPFIAAGAYFLKFTSQKSGKNYTDKIIVQ